MTAHSERAHARLSPSGSKRWINCPGSVRLEAQFPDVTSVYAAEGTAAHELAEKCLKSGKSAKSFIGQTVNGFDVTAEMADFVQIYVDWCYEQFRAGRKEKQAANEYLIEERVAIDAIGDSGTADLIVYRESDKTLVVGDLKYGRGVPVEAIDNTQGLLYALGAIKRFHNHDIQQVEITIVQPRAPHPDGPIRTWHVSYEVLVDWAFDLMAAVEATKQPDAPLAAGTWCQFCKAAASCPKLRDQAMENAMADFTADGQIIVPELDTLSVDARVKLYKGLDVLEIFCRKVREFEHAEAIHGRALPGFKLVGNRATRKWKDPASAEVELKLFAMESEKITIDDLYVPRELKSLAQVEKLVGKKDFGQFAELIEKKSSGTVLAPLDDPREPVTPDAIAEFSAVESD